MITVTISETNGKRKWSHRARTKDAMTAIIRTMNKHFPLSHNFIPESLYTEEEHLFGKRSRQAEKRVQYRMFRARISDL